MLAWLSLFVIASAAAQMPAGDPLRDAASYMDSRDYARAIEVLEERIRLAHPPAEAFLMLVDCRMRREEFEMALAAARMGIEKHPDSAPLLLAIGRVLLRDRRRSASAGEPLAKAARLAPEDPETRYYYSHWACLHNQEEICIREAEVALKLDPGNLQAELQLNTLIGVAAEKLDRPVAAEAAFRRSLASNRRLGLADPLAAFRYVNFLLKRGRDVDAQVLVKEILQKAPKFGPAYLTRAQFMAKKGEQQQALALAEKALTLQDMDKENQRAAHMLLARIYFLLGRENDAARHKVWIEQNPH